MIDLCQWRASIGFHHAAGSRALARTPGKRRLAGSAQQLAETVAIALASLLVAQCQLLFDSICHALLIRVLTFVAVFDCKLRQTGVSDVVCGGWFLSVSLLQALSGDLERSLSALAILLIMAGDVEQNPGPGTCIDDHINSTLACADVTYSMNPAVMVSSLLEIMSVVVCILLTSARINNIIRRPTIQVLVSGCSQTEVISTHSDSPGETLYQEVQRRSGIPVPLLTIMHSVNVIRRELSLGEQGIHHLSTIFLFVIGKGGGRTRLDQKPTMPELMSLQGRSQHINIVEGIGVKWEMVGTALLDDKHGTIITAIVQESGYNTERINMEILRRWVRGEGIPDCSWRGLLSVLRVHCRALAESMEEVLIAEEAEQATRMYSAALSHGYILATNTVCLISGAAGCGKTCVKCLIYGREPPQYHESTALAESVVRPMSMTTLDMKDDEWMDLDESKQLELLAEAMRRVVLSRTSLDSEVFRDIFDKIDLVPEDAETEAYKQNTSDSFVMKRLLELLAMSGHSSRVFLNVNHVYVIDSGGQSVFHELLSLFFNNIHVSISVVNLSLRLSERPIDVLSKDSVIYGAATKCSHTQEEILKRTFRAFQSQVGGIKRPYRLMYNTKAATKDNGDGDRYESKEKLPKLIVVGTHKDLEHKEEKVHHKNIRLLKLVKEFESHLISCGGGKADELIISVNARNPKQSDKNTIMGLKRIIATIAKSLPEEKIPIRWYVLELHLRRKVNAIFSFEQCFQEAKALGMEEDELMAALDYLMKQNTLFVYDCLPDLIFCNPQPLLDKMTELVEKCFQMRESESEVLDYVDQNFIKGFVTLDFLARDCFKKHYVSDDDVTFTPKEFITLMAYKRVVAKISEDEYFMPFILEEQEAIQLRKNVKPSQHVVPLAIRFPGGVAPAGVFCCLVASLLSPSNPQHSRWKLDRSCIFRNCIKLEQNFQELYDVSLMLIDSFTHFEAHMEIKGSTDSSVITMLCCTVKGDIQRHLEEVCKDRSLSHELGILCMPEARHDSTADCQIQPHFAILQDTGKKIVYHCGGVGCKERLVTEREKCWDLPYKVFEFPAVITDQPSDQLGVPRGRKASFSVTATGYNLNFYWEKTSPPSPNFTDVTKSDETVCFTTVDAVALTTTDANAEQGFKEKLVLQTDADAKQRSCKKLAEKPKLNLLRNFHGIDIARCIKDYERFGTLLLDEDYGNTVDGFDHEARGNVCAINHAILKEWVTKGKNRTWRRLIEVLDIMELIALVEDIREKLRDKVLKTSTHTTCANKAVLSISSVTKADEGEYRCVVRNAFGLKTSYPAQLTVLNPPFYTRIPATALLGLVLFVGGVLCALLIQRFLFYV